MTRSQLLDLHLVTAATRAAAALRVGGGGAGHSAPALWARGPEHGGMVKQVERPPGTTWPAVLPGPRIEFSATFSCHVTPAE